MWEYEFGKYFIYCYCNWKFRLALKNLFLFSLQILGLFLVDVCYTMVWVNARFWLALSFSHAGIGSSTPWHTQRFLHVWYLFLLKISKLPFLVADNKERFDVKLPITWFQFKNCEKPMDEQTFHDNPMSTSIPKWILLLSLLRYKCWQLVQWNG